MNIDETIQLALENLQSGNPEQAENLLYRVLSVQPTNINALHFLGLVYYESKNYDLAIEYIKKALCLNPSYADAYNNLGLALQEKGELNEAIMCYQRAIDLKPGFETAYSNLRNLLSESGYFNMAVRDYNEALFKCIKFMEAASDETKTKRNSINILVTGTGRCGTGYMAKLLTSAGFPCGHEEIFSFLVNTEKLLHNQPICESSWLAVPFLSSPQLCETTLIHAVRNPLRTVQSLIEIKFFLEKNFYYLFSEHFLPELKTLKPDKSPFYYFMEWTKMILQYEKGERYFRHRVDDDPVPLIKRLGGDITHLFSNTAYNTRRKLGSNLQLTPDDIPDDYKTEFLEISEQIGYKL
ncbi:MAG: tetratricopeptide repeat protein [Thermodesulfovibrionales bacterium]